MAKATKQIWIDSSCVECGGKGIVPHRHITNKRNKKTCTACKGEGQTRKSVEAVD